MSALESESETEVLLLRIVPALAEQWQGATPEAMVQIERLAGRPLPPFYRWFLARMGQSMGLLGYPTLDFSAQRVIACYTQGLVTPDPRFLMIGYERDELSPLHVFYDFEAPARADALVTCRDAQGGTLYDKFETLREMLAWGALLKFRIGKMPQQCDGTLTGDEPDLLSKLDPVMSGLGFTKPIPTGPFCGLYERPDAVMLCSTMPRRALNGLQGFTLGGNDAGTLRRILGVIGTQSLLEVEVDDWTPALA